MEELRRRSTAWQYKCTTIQLNNNYSTNMSVNNNLTKCTQTTRTTTNIIYDSVPFLVVAPVFIGWASWLAGLDWLLGWLGWLAGWLSGWQYKYTTIQLKHNYTTKMSVNDNLTKHTQTTKATTNIIFDSFPFLVVAPMFIGWAIWLVGQ